MSTPDNNGKTSMMGRTKVTWDDAKMRTTYSNVCNVATTREEIMLLFGTSQAWSGSNVEEVTVELSDRLLLNPVAAKRLLLLLSKSIENYEQTYGSLD